MTKNYRKDGVINQVKSKKRIMERKCTDKQYHAQDNSDVEHKDAKSILTQINSQNYHFVVHIPNLMAQED